MKGIVWKIFIPVLLAMASLVFLSLLLLANFGARLNQNAQQNIPQIYEQAKDALLDSKELGLRTWLEKNKSVSGLRVYILNQNGQDLLNRTLPPAHEILRGMNREFRNGPEERIGPRPRQRQERGFRDREERRTGRYPFLRSGTERYRFVLARPAGGMIGVLKSQKTFLPIFLSMILLSALVSALIARKISQPIQRLRHGVQKISSGNLQARISNDLSHRQDEIGALATDFDVMTDKLSALLNTQQKLLRDVSHELRSPLARLQVALGLAEKRNGDVLTPELQRIEQEANMLNEMIGKILSLVRMNNLSIDNSELQFEEFDVVNLFKPLVENANYEGQERQVSVKFNAPKSLILKVVPGLLSSALENILRNAIKFSTENSQVIFSVEQAENIVMLSVSNNGQQVAESELEKIFEPFYRVSQAREHGQGSGGIGLAIAKQAVELHAGSIKALNHEKGLQVLICIPS